MKEFIPALFVLLILLVSIQWSQKPEPGSEAHIKLATSLIDDAY